jgi:hypothetical protein
MNPTNLDDTLINICFRFLYKEKEKDLDKATADLISYIKQNKNKEQFVKAILEILQKSQDEFKILIYKQLYIRIYEKDIKVRPNFKEELNLLIISNISSYTAKKLLNNFESIYIIKEFLKNPGQYSIDRNFIINFLVKGLRNNNFLIALKEIKRSLNPIIISIMGKCCLAIKLIYAKYQFSHEIANKQHSKEIAVNQVLKLFKSLKFSVNELQLSDDVIKQIKKEVRLHGTDKKLLIKINKLFDILTSDNDVSISPQSTSSSLYKLDSINFLDYHNNKLEYAFKYYKMEEALMRCSINILNCDDNTKKFSINEFDIYYRNSSNETFIRKFKDNKCYSFTSETFQEFFDFD